MTGFSNVRATRHCAKAVAVSAIGEPEAAAALERAGDGGLARERRALLRAQRWHVIVRHAASSAATRTRAGRQRSDAVSDAGTRRVRARSGGGDAARRCR